MAQLPERFYKVESPYNRDNDSEDHYVVDPGGEFQGVNSGYGWFFDEAQEVECIEKLDGTNAALHIEEHEHGGCYVSKAAARHGDKSMNIVDPYSTRYHHHLIARGVQECVDRGYHEFLYENYGTGWFFGELIGPKFQQNPHEVDDYLFVPFDWLRDKCQYESYGKYSTEFEAIREWFRGGENGLFSLFNAKYHGESLDASRPAAGTYVEGLIFLHPDFEGRISPVNMKEGGCEVVKLRRDMFSDHAHDVWPMTKYGHH